MCGIFGVFIREGAKINVSRIKKLVKHLHKLSESRGKEAAGLAIRTPNKLFVYKEPCSASKMMRLPKYKKLLERVTAQVYDENSKITKSALAVIGHSRLVTNGAQTLDDNNQPIVKSGIVGVHNGIIVNDEELWKAFPELEKKSDVDTEVLLSLINFFTQKTGSLAEAIQKTFKEIKGAASTALLFEDKPFVVLATNTGSLYTCNSIDNSVYVFASEKYILSQLLKKFVFRGLFNSANISQLKPFNARILSLQELKIKSFGFDDGLSSDFLNDFPSASDYYNKAKSIVLSSETVSNVANLKIGDRDVISHIDSKTRGEEKKLLYYNPDIVLKRCTKCILPETFPNIEFDDEGVCNFCRAHKKIKVRGEKALKQFMLDYKRDDGEPDCIVALSGGRDSTFGLHYVKNVLKMHPVAFTYDWGMVTDLARRNQFRICGKLGVEHILRSANIIKKRSYIKKNIEAWLKRPELGMVPLFMAGDKQFYYYFDQLRKETGIKLVVFCSGNELEMTSFKLGFCGVKKGAEKGRMTSLTFLNKLRLFWYYLKQYILNPSYINSSLFDTVWAYYSSYILPDNLLYLYNYLEWDEKKITETLIKEYDWEVAPDTKGTWRIGDGTASFYNYIYYTMAGFSEHDTFRSNQVREGMLTREDALKFSRQDNVPRYESLKWYCDIVGVDFKTTITKINAAPKLYKKK